MNKPQVKKVYEVRNRRDSYPWAEDIDYEPNFDEDQEEE